MIIENIKEIINDLQLQLSESSLENNKFQGIHNHKRSVMRKTSRRWIFELAKQLKEFQSIFKQIKCSFQVSKADIVGQDRNFPYELN